MPPHIARHLEAMRGLADEIGPGGRGGGGGDWGATWAGGRGIKTNKYMLTPSDAATSHNGRAHD